MTLLSTFHLEQLERNARSWTLFRVEGDFRVSVMLPSHASGFNGWTWYSTNIVSPEDLWLTAHTLTGPFWLEYLVSRFHFPLEAYTAYRARVGAAPTSTRAEVASITLADLGL